MMSTYAQVNAGLLDRTKTPRMDYDHNSNGNIYFNEVNRAGRGVGSTRIIRSKCWFTNAPHSFLMFPFLPLLKFWQNTENILCD